MKTVAGRVYSETQELDAEVNRQREDDPRYQLLQRILATPDFLRSPQLSKFLLYVCTAAFDETAQHLSEQHIGVIVFGREPDYDSAADTIVRSHALRLRRRLEQYFQKAGKDEVFHLVIPRGSYTPSFIPAATSSHPTASSSIRHPEALSASNETGPEAPLHLSPVSALSTSEPTQGVTQPTRHLESRASVVRPLSLVWRYRLLTGFLALLFVLLSVTFVLHLRTHLRMSRRHPLWGRLFSEDQPTQIVLGDSGLVLFHAVTRQYVSLHDYLSNDYSKQMPFVEHVEPSFADFLLHRRYTSTVDALTLAHLVRLPEASPERTLVHYARDMHIEDFNTDNLILIGAEEAVPWVELFENHMDFVFSIDNPGRQSSFINRHPQSGELAAYSPYTDATKGKAYGVIAFLPNLGASGNVLILEGLSMVGTEATTDLAMDDKRLLPLLNGIRKRDGSLPHFEMLVESDILGDGSGPARVVAIHLHD
jgi:hypothetical protein